MIWGSPSGRSTPLAIPKSTGLSGVAGNVPPSCIVRPKRASFSRPPLNMCVSFTVSVLFTIERRWPNPGMLVPLRGRLDAADLLASEEHQQAIARPGVVPHVGGPGVLIDAGVGRADEPRRAVGVEIVRARDQRKQPRTTGSVAAERCASLSTTAVQVDALPLSQALVGREEERAAAKDRAAERAAELVAIERVRIGRRELEEVARVERLVAEELVGLAAEPIAPERVTRLTIAPDT